MDMQGIYNGSQESTTNALVQEMLDQGLQWGGKRSFVYPKMKKYVFTYKGELAVINLEKSFELWTKAFEFLKKLASEGKTVLFLGTQPAARESLAQAAKEISAPYMTRRWLGGTLTNFQTFRARMQHLKELEEKAASPDFANYTKKEQGDVQHEIDDIKEKFDGLVGMNAMPDALFVFCGKRHRVALAEAERKNIPVVGIFGLEDNPDKAAYPIALNDTSRRSVQFVMQKVKEIYETYRAAAPQQEKEKIESGKTEIATEDKKPSRRVVPRVRQAKGTGTA